jgi:xylan 1,4-beta-xylosidase
VKSDAAVDMNTILNEGVRQKPDVNALATRSARKIAVMIWNYKDEDESGPPAPVALSVSGVPVDAKRILLHHYRIDQEHSNAFTAWKTMGSPEKPTTEQYAQLEAAGQLQALHSPRWIDQHNGAVEMEFALPLQGLSLVELSW